jgi:FkbM family methyltransferase
MTGTHDEYVDNVASTHIKRLMDDPFISFSQNGEDVILNRLFKNKNSGVYVDVGAYHPIVKSTTYFAYLRGWRGVNIDISKVNIDRFDTVRPDDTNICAAIGIPGQKTPFYIIEGSTRSTNDPELASKYSKQGLAVEYSEIRTVGLDEILKKTGVDQIDFLSIDAEGSEKNVLKSVNFSKTRPTVILIEATYPEKTELTSDNWENIILEHNYVEIYFDGLNKYYLNQEKLDQFELPVTPKNYFDNYISYNEYCVLKKLKENML